MFCIKNPNSTEYAETHPVQRQLHFSIRDEEWFYYDVLGKYQSQKQG